MTPTALAEQTRLEADLSARALAGDVDAFTKLFAMHEQALQNVAYRVTGSREDAADIAQEAFLRVFARLDALAERPDVNLSAYLFRTARNLVYDHSGRAGRETLQDNLERSAEADEALEEDPERSRLVDAQVEEVRAANARLPERYRLVLALRELEGMSYDELGAALGVTTAAAGQALVRARVALRKELRLEQIDVDSLDPAVRERLADISAYIDGELSEPERAEVVELLEGDEAARCVKALFEEAGQRYRAWLPFPALLLGDRAARAAEAQGLLEPGAGGSASHGSVTAEHRRGTGPRTPRSWGSGKVKIGRSVMVLGTLVLLLATAAVTARVGVPVDTSSDEQEPERPVQARDRNAQQDPTEPPDADLETAPVASTPAVPVPAPAVSAAQTTSVAQAPPARSAPRPRLRPAAPAVTPPGPAPVQEASPPEPPAVVPEPESTPRPETREPETREPLDPNDPGPEPDPPDPGSVPPTGPGGFTIIPPAGSANGGGSGGAGGFATP